MLSRADWVNQIEMYKSDIENLKIKQQDYTRALKEATSPEEASLLKKKMTLLTLSMQEAECLIAIYQNEDTCSKVLTIISNFIEQNNSDFSTQYGIKWFENYIRKKINIPYLTLAFSSGPATPIYNERKLDMLSELISDYIGRSGSVLFLVLHDLIISEIITRSSSSWLTRFPQFSEVSTTESALEAYADLLLSNSKCNKSSDMLQFSCWYITYVTHNISVNTLAAALSEVEEQLPHYRKSLEKARFKRMMLATDGIEQTSGKTADNSVGHITLERIDGFTGAEFEHFVGEIFSADGYQVSYTKASNDKGIDIIARRGKLSLGIQCKCYSATVGVSAIQEVFSGKQFYSLDKALVVTNSTFTKAAIDLAQSTGVILWDRTMLDSKIRMLF